MPQQTSAGGGLKILGIASVALGCLIYLASGGADGGPSLFLALPFLIGGMLLTTMLLEVYLKLFASRRLQNQSVRKCFGGRIFADCEILIGQRSYGPECV